MANENQLFPCWGIGAQRDGWGWSKTHLPQLHTLQWALGWPLTSPKPPLPRTRYCLKVFLVTGCLWERGWGDMAE